MAQKHIIFYDELGLDVIKTVQTHSHAHIRNVLLNK